MSHRRPWGSGTAAALACIGGLLLHCGVAASAPTWLAPTSLQTLEEKVATPLAAADPAGDSFAVWETYDKSLTHFVLQADVRPAGGAWEVPVTLAESTSGLAPVLAVDPQGDATVAWSRGEGGGASVVELATRPAGAAWGSPVEISSSTEHEAAFPEIAVNGRGDAAIAWRDAEAGGVALKARDREAGGAWSAPATLLAAAPQNSVESVALDEQGAAIALMGKLNGATFEVWSAERPPGGSWQPGEARSEAGHEALDGELVFDVGGDATATWVEHLTGGTGETLVAASRPAGGAWQKAVAVSSKEHDTLSPRLAIDRSGDVTAAWAQETTSHHYELRAATRPFGGAWETPSTVASTVDEEFALAVAPGGQATMLWPAYLGGASYALDAAARSPGAAWPSPTMLYEAETQPNAPQLAADGEGDLTGLWYDAPSSRDVLHAIGFDAADPRLRNLLVPATGTVGVPVSFAVSPLDVWALPVAVGWSFGDGQTGAGATVTHTYTAPGTYTVALTGADAVGSVTGPSAQIKIAPAAGTGGEARHPAPTLTQLSQSHARWRTGPKRARLARAAKAVPVGTTFSFAVGQASRVSFSFVELLPGRKVAGRCVAPSRKDRAKRHCERKLKRGALTYTVAAGHHKLFFDGRINAGRRLSPGSYAVSVSAVETSTGAHAPARELRFTVVR
jgi:hypothetical protein